MHTFIFVCVSECMYIYLCCHWFEFIDFLLQHWLPYQVKTPQFAQIFSNKIESMHFPSQINMK